MKGLIFPFEIKGNTTYSREMDVHIRSFHPLVLNLVGRSIHCTKIITIIKITIVQKKISVGQSASTFDDLHQVIKSQRAKGYGSNL